LLFSGGLLACDWPPDTGNVGPPLRCRRGRQRLPCAGDLGEVEEGWEGETAQVAELSAVLVIPHFCFREKRFVVVFCHGVGLV
jgi:hypothetical protein